MKQYKYKHEKPGYFAAKSRLYRERWPEKVRAKNKRRNKAKQEWAYGKCPQCGGPFASANGKPNVKVCSDCAREKSEREARDRTIRFIALRKKGLLNTEIADREGCSTAVVANVLSRGSRYSLDAGRSPYHYKASA